MAWRRLGCGVIGVNVISWNSVAGYYFRLVFVVGRVVVEWWWW